MCEQIEKTELAFCGEILYNNLASSDLQRYRSGYNGPDSKSGVLATVPWVRIPPAAPRERHRLMPMSFLIKTGSVLRRQDWACFLSVKSGIHFDSDPFPLSCHLEPLSLIINAAHFQEKILRKSRITLGIVQVCPELFVTEMASFFRVVRILSCLARP